MATRRSSRTKATRSTDELRGPPLEVIRSLYTQPGLLEELDYSRQLYPLARSLELLMNDFFKDSKYETKLRDQLKQQNQELQVLVQSGDDSLIIDPAQGRLHLVRICGLDFVQLAVIRNQIQLREAPLDRDKLTWQLDLWFKAALLSHPRTQALFDDQAYLSGPYRETLEAAVAYIFIKTRPLPPPGPSVVAPVMIIYIVQHPRHKVYVPWPFYEYIDID